MQRYGFESGLLVEDSEHGQWVRYPDLAAAHAEIERLTKERDYKQTVIEKLSDHIEKAEAERDEAQTDLGKVILALPTGKGERAAGPVEGVKMMRKRLEAESDEARAQIAMAFRALIDAIDGSRIQGEIVGPNDAGYEDGLSEAQACIRAMSPADAKSALEAYGREKVREGMQQMLDRLRHEGQINPALTYADAIEWAEAVLAEMETLK